MKKFVFSFVAVLLFACNSVPEKTESIASYTNPDSELKLLLGDSSSMFFVSAKGDDSNPGTLEMPWENISYAISKLNEGETLIIRGGLYKQGLNIRKSGTAAAPLKIMGAPGETVVFDGTGITITNSKWEMFRGLVDISNQQHIELSNIQIVNSKYAGLMVYESKDIIVSDVYTENTFSSGIGVWFCNDIQIINNEVVLACNGGSQECISISQTDGFLVRGNIVRDGGPGDFGGEGIDAKDGSRNGAIVENTVFNLTRVGIYVDSWATHTYNIRVYNNRVYNVSAWGICAAAENGGLLEDIRIFKNFIHDNQVGIGVEGGEWGEAGAAHPMRDIYIYNNTILRNGMDYWGFGIHLNCNEAENVYIVNNIVDGNTSGQIYIEKGGMPTNLVFSSNYVDGEKQDILQTE